MNKLIMFILDFFSGVSVEGKRNVRNSKVICLTSAVSSCSTSDQCFLITDMKGFLKAFTDWTTEIKGRLEETVESTFLKGKA